MSKLVEFAERELKAAGLFDSDSDYGGELGSAVLELVKAFAAQGHSGCSAGMTLELFGKVAAWKPIMPLKNPMETGEYIKHDYNSHEGHPVMQSTRRSSVFSNDGGKTWVDIDLPVPFFARIRGHRAMKISFPYRVS